MGIDVRDAVAADMDSCHRCLDEVAREHRWLSQLNASPPGNYAAFWGYLQASKAPHIVAVDDTRVVGWCDITPDATPVRAHIGSLGMGLLSSHRGRGAGRKLLTLALERAHQLKLERIELAVLHDNTTALNLYESLGFVTEGRLVRDWKHNGVYRDSILMAVSISA